MAIDEATRARIAAHAAQLAAEAPELTAEQRDRLGGLLRGSRAADVPRPRVLRLAA